MKDKVTLCYRCKRDYIYAGIQVEPTYLITAKEPCEICGKPGWEYWVERNAKDKPVLS